MTNLEIAKKIIKANFENAPFGLFDCLDVAGDAKEILYNRNGLVILIAPVWEYFEVFGLTDYEFEELHKFYKSLKGF